MGKYKADIDEYCLQGDQWIMKEGGVDCCINIFERRLIIMEDGGVHKHH